jgi:hypothetical protein
MLYGGGFTLDNLSSLLLRQLESSEKVLMCFGYMIYIATKCLDGPDDCGMKKLNRMRVSSRYLCISGEVGSMKIDR